MDSTEPNPTLAAGRYRAAGVRPAFRGSFLDSFRFAFEGLVYVFQTQPNFRVHMAAACAASVLGAWLQLSWLAWAILALTIGGVLISEIMNTAAEALVDLVSPQYHPLAKQVKDLTAAAVLVAAATSVVVGLAVLGPPLWLRLGVG